MSRRGAFYTNSSVNTQEFLVPLQISDNTLLASSVLGGLFVFLLRYVLL